MNKNLLVVLGVLAIIGAYFFPRIHQSNSIATASPVGTTFLSQKAAGQQLSVSSSTILSLLNNDGQARTILSVNAYLQTPATTTTYTVACATSSTQFWPASANANVILQQSLQNIGAGTTTGSGLYISSTSPGVTGIAVGSASTTARLWPSGAYMVCKETSSPALDLLPSGSNAVISFPYLGQ